jgi:hypothetical protein
MKHFSAHSLPYRKNFQKNTSLNISLMFLNHNCFEELPSTFNSRCYSMYLHPPPLNSAQQANENLVYDLISLVANRDSLKINHFFQTYITDPAETLLEKPADEMTQKGCFSLGKFLMNTGLKALGGAVIGKQLAGQAWFVISWTPTVCSTIYNKARKNCPRPMQAAHTKASGAWNYLYSKGEENFPGTTHAINNRVKAIGSNISSGKRIIFECATKMSGHAQKAACWLPKRVFKKPVNSAAQKIVTATALDNMLENFIYLLIARQVGTFLNTKNSGFAAALRISQNSAGLFKELMHPDAKTLQQRYEENNVYWTTETACSRFADGFQRGQLGASLREIIKEVFTAVLQDAKARLFRITVLADYIYEEGQKIIKGVTFFQGVGSFMEIKALAGHILNEYQSLTEALKRARTQASSLAGATTVAEQVAAQLNIPKTQRAIFQAKLSLIAGKKAVPETLFYIDCLSQLDQFTKFFPGHAAAIASYLGISLANYMRDNFYGSSAFAENPEFFSHASAVNNSFYYLPGVWTEAGFTTPLGLRWMPFGEHIYNFGGNMLLTPITLYLFCGAMIGLLRCIPSPRGPYYTVKGLAFGTWSALCSFRPPSSSSNLPLAAAAARPLSGGEVANQIDAMFQPPFQNEWEDSAAAYPSSSNASGSANPYGYYDNNRDEEKFNQRAPTYTAASASSGNGPCSLPPLPAAAAASSYISSGEELHISRARAGSHASDSSLATTPPRRSSADSPSSAASAAEPTHDAAPELSPHARHTPALSSGPQVLAEQVNVPAAAPPPVALPASRRASEAAAPDFPRSPPRSRAPSAGHAATAADEEKGGAPPPLVRARQSAEENITRGNAILILLRLLRGKIPPLYENIGSERENIILLFYNLDAQNIKNSQAISVALKHLGITDANDQQLQLITHITDDNQAIKCWKMLLTPNHMLHLEKIYKRAITRVENISSICEHKPKRPVLPENIFADDDYYCTDCCYFLKVSSLRKKDKVCDKYTP